MNDAAVGNDAKQRAALSADNLSSKQPSSIHPTPLLQLSSKLITQSSSPSVSPQKGNFFGGALTFCHAHASQFFLQRFHQYKGQFSGKAQFKAVAEKSKAHGMEQGRKKTFKRGLVENCKIINKIVSPRRL